MQKFAPQTVNALKAFGQIIRAERRRLGLSQEELAERADVHATYVGKVERGEKNVSFENILRIAHGLRVKPSALFDRVGL